ncbi:hypothetical protein [Burkholderia ubonensis]|uniref:hypothetical protein n=1 Tax=Burkholderia ubonensis TaxID=101571 RepID=UPI000AD92672|nr:hypothetical protein [Burkholderia ubonensis]
MTKLTYTTRTSLRAAYRSGVKFEIVNSNGDRFPVATLTFGPIPSTVDVVVAHGRRYCGIRPDGTFSAAGMEEVRLEHAAPAAVEIYPLPFKTFQEVEDAFAAGTKFVIKRSAGELDVVRVQATGGALAVYYSDSNSHYGCFQPDGHNNADASAKLVVRGEIKRPVTPAVPSPKPVVPTKTFLEQFIAGSEFHSPHTRETVIDVKFVRGQGRMDVTLRDETGKERVTPRYNLDGTHKFRPERNLVAGKLPSKMVERKVTIYRHAYNGSLFVIREGEVLPNIRGISNATQVGFTTIKEPQ